MTKWVGDGWICHWFFELDHRNSTVSGLQSGSFGKSTQIHHLIFHVFFFAMSKNKSQPNTHLHHLMCFFCLMGFFDDRVFYGFFPWVFYGNSMVFYGFLWEFYGFPWFFPWVFHGFLWEFYGFPWFSMGILWFSMVFYGNSMGFLWLFGCLKHVPPVLSKTSRRLSAAPSDRSDATTASGDHEGRPLESGGVLQMGVTADVEIHTIVCLAGIHTCIIELSGAFLYLLPGRWNWGRMKSFNHLFRIEIHTIVCLADGIFTTFFEKKKILLRIFEKNEEALYFFSEKKDPR